MPTVDVNNTQLAYALVGEGSETLLLLPGLATGMSYYKFVEPYLRNRLRLLLVDPRGLAGSPSDDTEYTSETWADDFAALVEKLDLGRVHVAGSSHGGSMALAMADRHPHAVASLSVIGGFSELNRVMEINLRMRINIVSKLGMGPEIADHVTLWTNRADFLDSPEGAAAVETNTQAIMNANPQRYIAMVKSMQHWGRVLPEQAGEPVFTTKLPSIRVPTLALTGDSDHYIPARLSRIIADGIPGAVYREISQCGHIAVQERPEETAELLFDFISSVR